MAKKERPPQGAKVIAIANQKGGTAKTTSAAVEYSVHNAIQSLRKFFKNF